MESMYWTGSKKYSPRMRPPDNTNNVEEKNDDEDNFAHAEEAPEGLDITTGMCPPDLAANLVSWCASQNWGRGKLLQFGWE